MGNLTKLNDFLFQRIDKTNFLYFKKAQFTAFSDLLFILLMAGLCIAAMNYNDVQRFNQTISLALPVITVAIMSFLAIISGKSDLGANIMAVGACILAVAGFLNRPPHLAGVSLGYFMYIAVVYASFFCTSILSGIILLVFLCTHAYYFFILAGPETTGILSETLRTAFYDGFITLISVYITGFFANKFMKRALLQSMDESEKNARQFTFISNLLETIEKTSLNLQESIEMNSKVIDSYTDNAQNQAASVEELTSTMEEMSAGTESVAKETTSQNSALLSLTECLDTLAMSIDSNEHYSREINQLFIQFVELTREGKQSSIELDETNKKIYHNSSEIEKVTTIIEEFFDKINLLALNASIEAARAGEFGRGFGVVADEIGKLADTSQQELKQIAALIGKNRSDVEDGNKIITNILSFIENLLGNFQAIQGKSIDAVQEIKEQKKLKELMNERAQIVKDKSGFIDNSMQEQKIAIEDIVKSIENTSHIVQKNAENTEILKDNSEKIRILAGELKEKFSNK